MSKLFLRLCWYFTVCFRKGYQPLGEVFVVSNLNPRENKLPTRLRFGHLRRPSIKLSFHGYCAWFSWGKLNYVVSLWFLHLSFLLKRINLRVGVLRTKHLYVRVFHYVQRSRLDLISDGILRFVVYALRRLHFVVLRSREPHIRMYGNHLLGIKSSTGGSPWSRFYRELNGLFVLPWQKGRRDNGCRRCREKRIMLSVLRNSDLRGWL